MEDTELHKNCCIDKVLCDAEAQKKAQGRILQCPLAVKPYSTDHRENRPDFTEGLYIEGLYATGSVQSVCINLRAPGLIFTFLPSGEFLYHKGVYTCSLRSRSKAVSNSGAHAQKMALGQKDGSKIKGLLWVALSLSLALQCTALPALVYLSIAGDQRSTLRLVR